MRSLKSKNKESTASESSRKIEGKYSNYFKIGHNAFEFMIDFGQYYPEIEEAELYVRIITSPIHAKALLETLNNSIESYEKAFGAIEE